jgi:hypothetical protein
VREKYCSGWKNKPNKTDYKPDEQGLELHIAYLRVWYVFHFGYLLNDTDSAYTSEKNILVD